MRHTGGPANLTEAWSKFTVGGAGSDTIAGLVDDVRIYNRPVTQRDIGFIMNSQSP